MLGPTFLRSSLASYLAACGFILCWWTVAFSSLKKPLIAFTPVTTQLPVQSSATCPLLPFDRTQWHRALTGDLNAMKQLLAEWQIENQLLQSHGSITSSSFSPSSFLRAQELVHRLLAREQGIPHPLPSYEWQTDDGGTLLTLDNPPSRFLPQTELSAVILLTLCPSQQIVALPPRLRALPLFPSEILESVPCDLDRNCSESLFFLKTDVAFIAHYTQGSTVQALKDQQIAPFLTTKLNSLQEVLESIQTLGHVVGQSEKAELLVLFVQAGLSTLDNRLKAHKMRLGLEEETVNSTITSRDRPLYLQTVSPFSAPTERCLSGQLARRLGMNQGLESLSDTDWSIPLDGEMLEHLAPTLLICALPHFQNTLSALYRHPLLAHTPAAHNQRIFIVDEAFQDSPTHFLLLGYFDLVNCLMGPYQDRDHA